ncbi:SCO family protein [Ruegeria sp. ANG-S4]|uniref:SCO family protein n=1 Tax=Ruegeria sp. ANG-S4 TaxID=1577904 RepID=UPI0009E247FF|nr:SCO family protein [Ruegeria sp. ANG-S4]
MAAIPFAVSREAEAPITASGLSKHFEVGDDFQYEPPEPGTYDLVAVKSAPTGQVLDTSGAQRDLGTLLNGKISLVSFVYLTCGDINGCPLAMSTLFDIYETSLMIPGLGEDVQLVTISFDPERDTVDAINSFMLPFASDAEKDQKFDWHVLTTEGQKKLAPILEGFGQVVDRGSPDGQINHLLRMYLVDRDGAIRNIYGLGQIDPRLLMGDVETLLLSEQSS